jgi:D-ribose pyranase
MKKTALLHAELSETIASFGHGDALVIGDAGMPIPAGPRRIDLALTRGVPSFEQVLRATLAEMQVERVVLAGETNRQSPAVARLVAELLPGVPIEEVTHAELKARSAGARAMVRTGEFTPYANVMLIAGVVF